VPHRGLQQTPNYPVERYFLPAGKRAYCVASFGFSLKRAYFSVKLQWISLCWRRKETITKKAVHIPGIANRKCKLECSFADDSKLVILFECKYSETVSAVSRTQSILRVLLKLFQTNRPKKVSNHWTDKTSVKNESEMQIKIWKKSLNKTLKLSATN
jgi:hypothetical protein